MTTEYSLAWFELVGAYISMESMLQQHHFGVESKRKDRDTFAERIHCNRCCSLA
jgi:hypothetical protein